MTPQRPLRTVCAIGMALPLMLTGCSTEHSPQPDRGSSVELQRPDAGPLPRPDRLSEPCSPAVLKVEILNGLGERRGQTRLALLLRASHGNRCTVQGVPFVQLGQSADNPVGSTGTRVHGVAQPTITLHDDVAARAEIAVDTDATGVPFDCDSHPVNGLLVRLSARTSALWAPFPDPAFAIYPTHACTNGATDIAVRPLMPTH